MKKRMRLLLVVAVLVFLLAAPAVWRYGIQDGFWPFAPPGEIDYHDGYIVASSTYKDGKVIFYEYHDRVLVQIHVTCPGSGRVDSIYLDEGGTIRTEVRYTK